MKTKRILVTGGLGFIGSHTVVALQNEGYEVVIIDNLSNSSLDVLAGITQITGKTPEFENIDLREKAAVKSFFDQYTDIEDVIHFAASKAVGESVTNPLLYYENNISTLVYLLHELNKKEGARFIFSSSCTVYGQADELPITEDAPVKKAESPYGNTKQIGEEIIHDTCKTNVDFKAISLRYFNPIGAHPTAEIGELPIGTPQNLVPFITQTAIGKREELSVFGDDYPTNDGTAVRDYIHVMDLAEAHVHALQRLMHGKEKNNYEVFNLGTGKGNSVLEVINSFEKVSGEKLPHKIVGRREGDITAAYADTTKANNELNWKAERTLDDALKSAWKWQQVVKRKEEEEN
ncbi:UDP-glucose 4-epimerase GalE [Christiangramia forsetii]|uniref:UDP-glucose 4-epimerase n=2 Tax=Christiangramia forsetii TaxID=411153 RepID=A0M1J9_CHRFK|nr:UDP-glucose 4-epimerase GalE [Christiangramia forsetii]GGG42339.1 UDP-glucose 4-epimerase [Christiangramia forsetii]CAL66494.1 secreted UDP-glucose 4-epimerase [Christiangramia forsetii KT0803]